MTYIILKYNSDPKRRLEKVTTLKHLFPNNDHINKEHGLKPTDKIRVLHTKRCYNPRNGWKNWRTPFKMVFSGTVSEFDKFSYNFIHNNPKRKKNKNGRTRKTSEVVEDKD